MTTFVAWVGVDQRGVASINFATDSRISWSGSGCYWDVARKTFSCATSPDIFGYLNDVMFPSIVLGQIVSAIDCGVLFGKNEESCDIRFNVVVDQIKRSHESYPSKKRESFCIFHGARESEGLSSTFKLNVLEWDKNTKKWNVECLLMPDASSAIVVDGSGKNVMNKWSERWSSSSQGGTSRAVFSSFCNAVYSSEDSCTYGAPQIVSLWRQGFGKTIGFVDAGKKFVAGMEIANAHEMRNKEMEWRNRYFERCDAHGELLKGAQKHHVPKGLL